MKVRNILIGLVVVLMAFVFISCDEEPEEQVQPTPTQEVVYTLSAKKGVSEGYYDNDKPRLVFTDKINDGDTLSLQFRSERDVYQFDIRNGSGKWVYQQDSSALTSFEEGEDGWITLTYTFGASYYDGKAVSYPQDGFDIRFRGRYFAGDLFEVKNVKINGELIPLKTEEEEGFTLTGFELAAADAVFGAKSYAVVYSVARPGDDDKTPLMEKVASGAKPAAANLEKTGYELELFTQYDEKGAGYVEDSKITLAQLRDLAIEKDTIIYLRYTGIPRTVTFMNGETQFDQKQTLHGTAVAAPATAPTKEGGYQFAAWCSDSGLTTEVNLAETPITADTTLYAKFVKTWTVSFNLNGKPATAIADQIIVDGEKATAPATNPKTSGFRFKRWLLDDQEFNFDSFITTDVELVAEWEEAETVNFTYNKNDGSDASSVIPTFVGEPATSTKPADPERYGYRFDGWFTAAEGGTEYTFTEDVTAAKVLYAHWVEQVVKLTASKGRNDGWDTYDKFELVFNTEGDNKTIEEVKSGDTLVITFRTTRDPYQFNVRVADVNKNDSVSDEGGDQRWVYESASSALTSYDTVTYAEAGGWIVATYEFSDYAARVNGDKTNHTMTDEIYAGVKNFAFHFRGHIIPGDFLEIKSILLNGEPVDITKAATAALGLSGDAVREAGSISVIDLEDSTWTGNSTVTMFFYNESTTISTGLAFATGTKATAPVVSKNGYHLIGWCKDTTYDGSDLTRLWNFENDAENGRKLYAIWEADAE